MCHVFLLFLAFQSVSPEAAQHARAGLQAKQEGHLDVAIYEFQKVTTLEPNLAAAFVNLGAAYMENREPGSAIPPLKRAIELDPSLMGAHQMLGYALLAQGYAAEAIPHFKQARVVDGLGIAQLESGKLPEAITNLGAALAQRPQNPDLLYYLGRATGLLSKQAFDALLAADPDSGRAHQAMGENYAALRRVPEAEREYQTALQQRPDTPGLHLELGELYANAAQWQNAETEYRVESKLKPGSAEAAFRLGGALLQNGKSREARAELGRANLLQPGMPETLYSLGKAALLDGDLTEAEKAWKELLSVEQNTPLSGQAHFALANLYRKQGKTAEADRETMEYRKLQRAAPVH